MLRCRHIKEMIKKRKFLEKKCFIENSTQTHTISKFMIFFFRLNGIHGEILTVVFTFFALNMNDSIEI